MVYYVPEHNIFNPLFYRISSTFKPIQDIQYTIDGVVFRPHSYYFRRARKDYREWLNFLIPSAAACTRNLIGSIDRGLSILNYRYTVEIGSRACTDVLRESSCATHECSGWNPRAVLLRIIVGERRLMSKEGRLQRILFKADEPIGKISGLRFRFLNCMM